MSETTGQWRDDGSRSGHIQAVVLTGQMRVDAAWRAYLAHTADCGSCRVDGVDCQTAAELKQAWRDAKDA